MKEITKRYEQHFGFNIENVIKELEGKELKGEFTLIISGNKKIESNNELKEQYLRNELKIYSNKESEIKDKLNHYKV